ncbi:hypothetical protein [Georgenia sp. H159]|uniref:hypothetical protein n=1 Tax=Georgenia sp. H159 TaxID=3076115 RepID=UPI002D7A34FD|nr:hypothetical protein [Georgenia sp. H159]
MRLTMRFGENGAPTTIVLAGDLDVAAANEFTHIVLGLHDIVGVDVAYDFRAVRVRDGAGRSAIAMVAHTFREFGPVQLPADLESAATP